MSFSGTGVYPAWENMLKIGIGSATPANMKPIADIESFSLSIDGNVEEWKPFEAQGWTRRLMTGKSLSISASGKRNIGDPGNDFIASLAFLSGAEVTAPVEWTFPNGDKLTFNAVVSVTDVGAGESTSVGGLEFEMQCDGKPTYTPATQATTAK